MAITIKKISVTKDFKYLWLKYVTGYDLSMHCAKSLLGNYSSRISAYIKDEENIILDEFKDAEVIYLCGVSRPYVWRNNFHLALKHKEGSNIVINENGIYLEIQNAERIKIEYRSEYSKHENGKNKDFCTCRNWIFAYNQMFNKNL